ncbi:MAG: DUF5110 domain-containing protein [Bacteroidales bacterium]|nr:DUF5110 domain-containing protein [Candidatus Cryptobacteroides caccocaballi]
MVRVQKAPQGGSVKDKDSFSVIVSPESVTVKTSKGKESTRYSSSKLSVTVTKDGQVSFATSNGKALLKEGPYTFTMRQEGLDKGAYIVSQNFKLDADEPIYGLGILQDGQLSLRGKSRYLRQDNTEDFVPIIQSIKGYGILWDNPSTANFRDDENGTVFESEVGEQVDYYFIYGGNADGVIAGIRKLTGSVPMLPMWSYGFMQSRERYKSSAEILGALNGYRERNVPIDCVIQDWQYWGNNYQWNAMEFLNDEFRRPQAMIDEIHDKNAHLLISIWASFGPMTKPFRELDAKGHLLHFGTWPQSGLSDWPPRMDYPSGVLPYDPFSEEARDIYWNNLLRLENMGIDGWWMDSTEPDHLDYQDSDLEQMTGQGSYRSVLNAYPLFSVEGVVNKQLGVSDRRPMILTRSAYAGQQRTGANTWSGDVQSTWDDLRHQIPAGLGFTLTGNPNFNSDIGGFFPGGYNKRGEAQTCHKNPLFQELYVRWLQFGLFNPMMRSHGETSRREIWEFGEKGEPIYDAIEKSIRMRYALMPYIYSTSWQVTSDNGSFMRALMMDFPKDRNTWENNSEFMFGKSLLVAPVNKALYTREDRTWSEEKVDWTVHQSFDVYLPTGAKWYDWWTGKLYNGGQTISADAAIDRCPVYVKAGSIIPVGPDVQYVNEKPWDDLEIRVYPGADGSFTLYEDEGDNQNYKDGAYSTIKFTLKGSTLTIGAREGSFEGMLMDRTFRVVFMDRNIQKTVRYSGNAVTVR